MGVLAWLMLVINSLAGAPMGMAEGAYAHSMHATATATNEHNHHRAAPDHESCGDDQGHACGGMTGMTCHCVAMCSTALPMAEVAVLAPIATTVSYATLLPDNAPSLDTAPPLRPPAV